MTGPWGQSQTLTLFPQGVLLLHPEPQSSLHLVITVSLPSMHPKTPPLRLNYFGEIQTPRPQFHGKSVHACISEAGTIDAASTSGLQDQRVVIVICVPDSQTPGPQSLRMQAHHVWCQKGSPQLELPPLGQKGKQEDPSSLCF